VETGAAREPARAAAAGSSRETVRAAVRDVGGVLLTWGFVVVAEFVVIGVTCAGLFAGNWELVLGRKLVGPIALAMLLPASVVTVAAGRLAARAVESRSAKLCVSALAGVAAGAEALGVSQGRHFASLAARLPFVALLAAAGFGGAYFLSVPFTRVLAGPRGRAIALFAGLSGAALFWLVDARVLPRLYPAFHTLVAALMLAFAALTLLAWRTRRPAPVPVGERVIGFVGLACGLFAVAWAPIAAGRLQRSDNLRFVLEEHAPLLGRAVRVAAWLSPPVPLADDEAVSPSPALAEMPRALDWGGTDILLITVDALRADHLGAYGYARPTTPNLDALAQTSALFEYAYCPTPHTSYSVTSMMTGKAMRPLLSLGLGTDSDTWATDLRRYGYKTAAFYPPAVFYIDEDRFTELEKSGLGFEYRWVEFTSAEAKVKEVEAYLAHAGADPVFLWVHLFEPHEPYVGHAGHDFGHDPKLPVDVYDSEVAYADAAIGELLRVVKARRPKLTVIVTADHGEEFGEHGGRYHGTTCYEEQVRVPLLVSGPGVVARRVPTVVQTIDLLPTVLSALGIPRPARVRGRDLGEVLAFTAGRGVNDEARTAADLGLAYAETDEQTLLARGNDRLICARKIAACALYDARDPLERVDLAPSRPAVARELRAMTAGIERDQGRYEASLVAWPDALRRGLQGEVDAAEDVAGLLDDASVAIRRKAAEVSLRLAVRDVRPQIERALARDEDEEVKRWASLALVRMGEAPTARAEALVHDTDRQWRRVAALAFAEAGDARGKTELATWWHEEGPPHAGLDTAGAKEILGAVAHIKDELAVPALLASLEYVPLRPRLAETLGEIGDARARAPLLALFGHERYETARPFEASALVALGAGRDLLPSLTLFAGLADPMTDAVSIAFGAKLIDSRAAGVSFESPVVDVDFAPSVGAGRRALRVWVLSAAEGGAVSVNVDGVPAQSVSGRALAHAADVDLGPDERNVPTVRVQAHGDKGIRAIWVVPRVTDLPPFLRPHGPDAGDAAR